MHAFRSHRDTPGMFRGHLTFGLPDNPICWLLGHSARVEIVEPNYIPPYRVVRCRWCDRQYHSPLTEKVIADMIDELVATGTPRHSARRDAVHNLEARQVANVRELGPKAVAASIEGRDPGWSTHERRGEFNVEAVWYPRYHRQTWRPRQILNNLGFRLHTGGRGSETPIDASLHLGLGSVYASTSLGGRVTEWVGRGHKRQLSVQTHSGSLWWQVWYDDDGGNDTYHRCDKWRQPRVWPWSAGRRKHRGWMCLRSGNIALNPAEALWGHRDYKREPVESPVVVGVPVGEFPGDTYLVELTLERTWRQRDHGPRWFRRATPTGYSVAWDTRGHCNGIPVRNDSWKGDEVLASGVRLPDELDAVASAAAGDGAWQAAAVRLIVEQIKRDRRHYGYVPPRTAAG